MEKFESLQSVILNRRTTKVAKMNGTVISQDKIDQLLTLADAAPTHARTEPWRFKIYSGESLQKFCKDHAELYWNNTSEDKRLETTRDNFANQYQHASHLIITYMRRTPEAKIPWLEEYAATSAAIQNILLGATALDIAAIWSTGGMALKDPMKAYLQLAEEDAVIAFIYLGYADEYPAPVVRKIPIQDKITN